MKSLKRWAGLLALPLVAGLVVSCNDDDNNDQTVDLKPTLVLDGSGDFIDEDVVVETGASLDFKVIANENTESNKNLDRFEIKRVFNNVDTIVVDSSFNERSFQAEYTFTAQAETGEENFFFTITDRDGESAQRVIKVTTISDNLVQNTGSFYHAEGACPGGFDLVNGELVSLSNGDDADQDLASAAVAGNDFEGSWSSPAGGLFVATSLGGLQTFGGVNESDLEELYNDGTPSETVDNPEPFNAVLNNQYYVVNIKGTGRYGIIRIDSEDASENMCPDGSSTGNTGVINFTYRIPEDVANFE